MTENHPEIYIALHKNADTNSVYLIGVHDTLEGAELDCRTIHDPNGIYDTMPVKKQSLRFIFNPTTGDSFALEPGTDNPETGYYVHIRRLNYYPLGKPKVSGKSDE